MAKAMLLKTALLVASADVASAVRQLMTSQNVLNAENATSHLAIEEKQEQEERSLLAPRILGDEEEAAAEKPSYRQKEYLMPGLVHNEFVQQFKVKEDNHFMSKEYKVKLEQFEEAGYSGREIGRDIDVKDLVHIDPHFWTMHKASTLTLYDFNGNFRNLSMHAPQIVNRRWSWRITPQNDPNNVLFTIQKRLWNDHCKWFGWFKCKAIWKIYEGHRGDKSTLIYYGVDDADDQDEPHFRFYHSEYDYKQSNKHYYTHVAEIDHKKHAESDLEDTYKVKVQPHEDAALIVVATACIDYVADSYRAKQEEHYHGDH